MQHDLNTEIPHARAAYDRSLQARNALPEGLFTTVQSITVIAALLFLAWAMPRTLRRAGTHRNRLLALTGVILFVIIANAAVSGGLSAVDSRYQARIVWLVPMLAAFYLLELPLFARQRDR
jgi:hypothetical protein